MSYTEKESFVFEKYADELCKKEAARYINTTPENLSTMQSSKRYDLKPYKKADGKIYFKRAVLDEHVKKDL